MTEKELQYPLQLGGPASEMPIGTASEQLRQVAAAVDGPPLTWHAKDGSLCPTPATCKKRRHVTNPQVLRNAGIEPKIPGATVGEPARRELNMSDEDRDATVNAILNAFPAILRCHPDAGISAKWVDTIGWVVACEEANTDATCGARFLAVDQPVEPGGPAVWQFTPLGDDPAKAAKDAARRDALGTTETCTSIEPATCADARCPVHGVIAPEPPKTAPDVVTLEGYRGRHGLETPDANCYDAACEKIHTTGVPPRIEGEPQGGGDAANA